jgi:Flp pilus assembly CpaE family ATPase
VVFGTAVNNGELLAKTSGAGKVNEAVNKLAAIVSAKAPVKKAEKKFDLANLFKKK